MILNLNPMNWITPHMPTIKTISGDLLIGFRVYPKGSKVETDVYTGLRNVAAGLAEWVGGQPELDEDGRNYSAKMAKKFFKAPPVPKKPTGYWARLRAIDRTLTVGNAVIEPGQTAETDDPWTVARLVGEGFAECVESKGSLPPEALARFHDLADKVARERKAAASAPVALNVEKFRPTLNPVGAL